MQSADSPFLHCSDLDTEPGSHAGRVRVQGGELEAYPAIASVAKCEACENLHQMSRWQTLLARLVVAEIVRDHMWIAHGVMGDDVEKSDEPILDSVTEGIRADEHETGDCGEE